MPLRARARTLALPLVTTLAPVLALQLAGCGGAEAPAAAPGAPAHTHIVLRAARLFDGRSDAVIAGATVVIEDDRITGVGAGAAIPEGAEVIDLGDATLLPGFIDAHTHLSHESSENWAGDVVEGTMRFPAEQAHYAASYAKKTLEGGFTTVRDLGSGSDGIDTGLRDAITAGLAEGPRILAARAPVGSTGGHADGLPIPVERLGHLPGPIDGICNGADECREAVRWQIKYGADVIKFMPSGGVLSLSDPVDVPQLTQAEMNAIVGEAHAWGRKAAAHCHGDEAARMAIAAGVDSIEHGSFLLPKTLAEMKARGVFLVPTALAVATVARKAAEGKLPPPIAEKARAAVAGHARMFREALAAGVRIGLGTDSGVSVHGINAREFGLMVGLGMTPAAALRAGTSSDAELLGLADRIGTVEKGKLADLVAVPGDPLADIHVTERVLFVMKGGRVVVRPPAAEPR